MADLWLGHDLLSLLPRVFHNVADELRRYHALVVVRKDDAISALDERLEGREELLGHVRVHIGTGFSVDSKVLTMIKDETCLETGGSLVHNHARQVNAFLLQFVLKPFSGFIVTDNAEHFHLCTQSY